MSGVDRNSYRDLLKAALWTLGSLLLAALVCVDSARGGPSQLIRNLRAGNSQTVVAYGTSLTFGEWPDQLATWLDSEFAAPAQVINSGIPGMSSQSTIPARDAQVRLNALVLSHNPDTVFLEFAVNDALLDRNISLQQSRDNLNTIIDRILADDPGREIILMTMNPAWDPPGQFPAGSFRPNLAEYYQVYRDVAADRGLLLIDHYANWVRLRDADQALFEQYIPDGVHPTGVALLDVVTPEIIRALTVPEPGSTAMSLAVFCGAVGARRPRRTPRFNWRRTSTPATSPSKT
jgi:lysophospholipase L1-like esterase